MLDALFREKIEIDSIKNIYKHLLIPYAKKKIATSSWDNIRSEANPLLKKIVLEFWESSDIELRFHFYGENHQEPNIHDHRWPFYSFIVNGTIKEIKYKSDNGSFAHIQENTYKAGDAYYVKETDYHTVFPSNDLITLILRGPGIKNSWNQFDLEGRFIKEYPLDVYNPNEKAISATKSRDYLELADSYL